MKLLIASDIHGSLKYARALAEIIDKDSYDALVLLGDLLYHGPRNALPEEYAPAEVARLLNSLAIRKLAVRGNCDSEVDQMLLDFPIMADHTVIFDGSRALYCTHGHNVSPDAPPKLDRDDVLLTGHTHIPTNERRGDFFAVNPGSVSIPKNGSRHSALVYENGAFTPIYLD